MSTARYYAILAYGFLVLSVAVLIIAILITGLIFADAFLHAGFGYPRWSLLIALLVACLGYITFKCALNFLRKQN
jgi:hypothetical protein